MKRILVPFAAACLTLLAPCPGLAQMRPTKHEPTKPAAAEPEAEQVNIHDTFVLSTASERWALEDPDPAGTVDFAGKKLSLDERKVNVSTSADGEKQVLYPVSWFEPYQGADPDLKYVVVKYKDGKACSIMAEYQPNRLSMPKARFMPHPDGKSFYTDVATVRQDGHMYCKQVVSQGRDDGKGGLYVDMLVMYCTEDTSAKPTSHRP